MAFQGARKWKGSGIRRCVRQSAGGSRAAAGVQKVRGFLCFVSIDVRGARTEVAGRTIFQSATGKRGPNSQLLCCTGRALRDGNSHTHNWLSLALNSLQSKLACRVPNEWLGTSRKGRAGKGGWSFRPRWSGGANDERERGARPSVVSCFRTPISKVCLAVVDSAQTRAVEVTGAKSRGPVLECSLGKAHCRSEWKLTLSARVSGGIASGFAC